MANVLSGFQRITGWGSKALPWVMLSFKVGNVPALIYTGAQFSFVRLNVAEFMSRAGETASFYHVPCCVR